MSEEGAAGAVNANPGNVVEEEAVLRTPDPSGNTEPTPTPIDLKSLELRIGALEAECKEQRARADELERRLIEDRPEAKVPKGLTDEVVALQACIGELLAHSDEGTIERCQKILHP